jgi:hypothetical protein
VAGTFGEPGVTFGQVGGTFGNAVVIPPPDWVVFEGGAVVTVRSIEGGNSVAVHVEGASALASGVLEGG